MPHATGPITTFVVEPFVPHQEEYYLSIQSTRLGYEVSFNEAGGMDIEVGGRPLATPLGLPPLCARVCMRRVYVQCIHMALYH